MLHPLKRGRVVRLDRRTRGLVRRDRLAVVLGEARQLPGRRLVQAAADGEVEQGELPLNVFAGEDRAEGQRRMGSHQ